MRYPICNISHDNCAIPPPPPKKKTQKSLRYYRYKCYAVRKVSLLLRYLRCYMWLSPLGTMWHFYVLLRKITKILDFVAFGARSRSARNVGFPWHASKMLSFTVFGNCECGVSHGNRDFTASIPEINILKYFFSRGQRPHVGYKLVYGHISMCCRDKNWSNFCLFSVKNWSKFIVSFCF